MCLVVLALDAHPAYPVILVGNRDEFHARPADAMHWWPSPRVLAGRDRSAGGTWLGVTPAGRAATVTNYRDPELHRTDALSRGALVLDALAAADMEGFGRDIEAGGARYNGFNLLWGDRRAWYYYSNRHGPAERLAPGLHGLSNGLLDTPWPKLVRVRRAVEGILSASGPLTTDALLAPFMDRRPAADEDLPDTGVPRDWERLLSSPFIVSPEYGTRASTAVLLGVDGAVEVREQTFDAAGGRVTDQTFRWTAP
ncbi:NRDE family protein [Aquisalimonas lutea]|uniref:NRDE family protein n=1 Tax=Aquisalimonas lutea TaxID=1327750 RepID=UPI0025B439B8|nr:NRDE family protein [Aquisalimonas lutea]MDN3517909.1 NRDE family protein [Aquisalimonas lutea]